MRWLRSSLVVAASVGGLVLAGCGVERPSAVSGVGTVAGVTGRVHGGQQAVSGSTIQLYTVGTGGDGSAATPLLTQTVTTDANGNFTISGLYNNCSGAGLVYITATGGHPTASTTNGNLAMMTALGQCTSLTSGTFISINEVTTVGAVAALAPYMTSYSAVGSGTSDAAALAAAFAMVSAYASPSLGLAPGPSVPAGMVAPVSEIDTLANIAAACVNSAGGVSGDGSVCGSLFAATTPSSGVAPTNTVMALLNVANNPTLNTGALFALGSAVAPFQPALSVTPPTFKVALMPEFPSGFGLQVGPSSISYPSTTLGMTSAAQMVLVQNNARTAISLDGMGLMGANAGDFAETGTCGLTLAVGASCLVQITFSPLAAGARVGYLSVMSSAGAPQYVELAGTGVASSSGGPHAVLSSGFITFGTQSLAQSVTLSNTGSGTLAIGSIAVGTTNYAVTNTCGTMLAAGASCTITAINVGGGNDEISIVSNDANSPAIVALSMISLSSPPTLSGSAPGNVFFPDTVVGQTSSVTVTLYGPSDSAYAFGPNAKDFEGNVYSGNCDGIYFYFYCTATLSFTPSGPGLRTALFATGYALIPVAGNGLAVAPTTSVTLSGAVFYDLAGPSAVTLSNYLNSAVSITSISVPTEFTETSSTCGSSLPAQSICTITIASSQTTAGGAEGEMVVAGSFGTVTSILESYIDPILSVGTAPVGGSSALTFTITGSGSDSLGSVMDGISVLTPGPFTGGSCTLPPYATQSCTYALTFTPTVAGFASATVQEETESSSHGTYTGNFLAEATGTTPGQGLTLTPTTFATAVRGPNTYTLTATNTGTAGLSLAGTPPVITGTNRSEFEVTGNTCATLAAGASCSLTILFTPVGAGAQVANIVFTDTLSGQKFMIPLTGTLTYSMTTSPTSLAFASTQVDVVSSPLSVTVTTPTNDPISASVTAGVFSLSKSSCAQGELPCLITAIFDPTAAQSYTGTITLTDMANGTTATVALTGVGTGVGVAVISPSSMTFPSRAVGTTSVPMALTLSNTGTASFAVSAVVLSGTNASEFTTSNTCGGSVAVSGSCTINVSFVPVSAGSKSASLVISGDTTAGLPLTVPITGTAY